MKHILKTLLTIFCFLLQIYTGAQLTLQQVINQAQQNSYSANLSKSELKLAEIAYASYKAGLKPLLTLYGNAPVFNKDNYAVTQPDGGIKFLPRSQNYSNLGISFSKPLSFSGGSISLNTDLYRFDDFVSKTKQYNGTPVFIKLNQPLFKYNAYKLGKKIATLKVEEANKTMKMSILQVAYEICRLYFDIIENQVDEQLATTNLENTETNLSIEKRRVELGVSTTDKVIQLEMQQINNQQQKIIAALNTRKAFLALQTFSNNEDTSLKKLLLPKNLPRINFNKEKAIAMAKTNLPLYLSFQRNILEAESKIEEARKQGKQVDLIASYGLNNAATDIPAIYRNPQDQQRFSIGFSIPIADWGKRKINIATAKTQAEKSAIGNKQEEAKLVLEITNLVNELYILQEQIEQSLSLDTLAQKRFAITNRLFQSGKASLIELQAAQSEKDSAKRNYIAALRKIWESHFLLSAKTGYKF